ncbi:hypothetical protein [Burkholderia gladioli]|uniref:hypothetical protein n=1 Tax=Burkholderia gladioli TaxID=28095 RepID=UPI0016400921|nr:hypothetical protein [Burkholderia gladioli]MDR8087800.1 hypothetical protein [Burkholderia gladioli]
MEKISQVSLKCPNGHKFPSPIFIGDKRSFDSATMSGNRTNCPKCGVVFSCNKENMSYVLADDSGGAVGDDFGSKDQ